MATAGALDQDRGRSARDGGEERDFGRGSGRRDLDAHRRADDGHQRGALTYYWSAIWIFLAWRFFRFGCYTSPWGVRICNPVLTWWYPWRRIDRFELGSTGEMFAPKAKAMILVSTRSTRRTIWSLATSMLFFRLKEDAQAELVGELNARLQQARARG